ncbi:MAG: Hsp20/alpha crystallin family protein [Nitrospirae bacterium]|nr:Hsp20/alpha crystallin family protein [Nitrospirota bacterium]
MKKWDPFKDTFALRERANRLFEHDASKASDVRTGVWVPAVDIYETDEAFVVKAELPEVTEADVNIVVEDNTLTISGERKSRREGKNYYQIERYSGAFSRSFVLPSTIEKSGIKATLKDGILNVILPRMAEELPKRIEID